MTKVCVILGLGDDASKASEFLRNRGFRIEGTYALTQIDNSSDGGNKIFKLDQERVQQLSQVVQFLEQ